LVAPKVPVKGGQLVNMKIKVNAYGEKRKTGGGVKEDGRPEMGDGGMSWRVAGCG
jgi:hypothetical protein